ncbi:LysE/ArgO family amino acid transporter [Psychromonas sp. Urea-02u-13]|uniref:LysE/ArgO family amino acid transporter n=1 Tax=Psychromonas sp. Urea-02u-13 TaxID=2058326 RepID=UPI000C3267BB|nr:LysE family transporter [Psychromonas sp. Urea-02u-13]PKG37830.1 arginine transporter [Psychromonas sp. Urea-02u-13]
MLTTYFTGLTLMATLIMPIGLQNAFVLNQGIRKQHHLFVASFCAFSDVLFMCVGVWGGATLFSAFPWLLMAITLLGATFMLVYGAQCLHRAVKGGGAIESDSKQRSFKMIVLACCAFTFLNPHVYIDTIVILGGFAANLLLEERPWFVLGGISASFLWFFGLALLGSKFAHILSSVKAQRIIDTLIGLMMCALAGFLLLRLGQ